MAVVQLPKPSRSKLYNQMPEANPYSPSTTNSGVDAASGLDKRNAVPAAVAIGLSCCLAGPIFLWLYWKVNGYDGGVMQTASFFGLIYVTPGLVAVSIGLLAGFLLSPVCPRLEDSKRWAVAICVALVANAIGIFLLLGDYLNFGCSFIAFELPAFSVACALASLTTTSVYLAFR